MIKSNNRSALLGIDLVDFHSHFLPRMDDGAKTLTESLAMLAVMAKQGVKKVVATPHFYPENEAPESFLARRERSYSLLAPELIPQLPQVFLGAEVAFFAGMSRCDDIKKLSIADTQLILVEMPFEKWSEGTIDEVLSLKPRQGLTPVIAHIERYPAVTNEHIDRLISSGVLIQSNAEFFLSFGSRRHARRMLEAQRIHLLGSDCHRLRRRVPNLGDAAFYIAEKSGRHTVERLFGFASSLIQ